MPSRRTPGPSRASTPQVVRIESWQEFLSEVAGDTYRHWAFRGQENAAWPLETTLARRLRAAGVHPKVWAAQEQRAIRIFQRKAHLYLDEEVPKNEYFRWLSIMQHYGAPTRLLDLTWSPFVAAFFALERASTVPDPGTGAEPLAAVWAINMPALSRNATIVPGSGRPVDTSEISPRHVPVDPGEPTTFERYFLSNELDLVYFGEPFVMNKRLVAQSGTFAMPGTIHQSVDQLLLSYRRPSATVTKFELLVSRMRREALRGLYTMNVTNATLFPDLDGLARSMAYELEYHWQYDPYDPAHGERDASDARAGRGGRKKR